MFKEQIDKLDGQSVVIRLKGDEDYVRGKVLRNYEDCVVISNSPVSDNLNDQTIVRHDAIAYIRRPRG